MNYSFMVEMKKRSNSLFSWKPRSFVRYGFITYDFEMRKFIKEKFGVEIESPVKKWSKLCWNCYSSNSGTGVDL